MPTPLLPAGLAADSSAAEGDRPRRQSTDPLSETCVLRLLNEIPAATPASPPQREIASRAPMRAAVANPCPCPCPRCGHRLAGDLAICPRCRTRLATSSREWQAVYRQAANFLSRR